MTEVCPLCKEPMKPMLNHLAWVCLNYHRIREYYFALKRTNDSRQGAK